MAVRRRKRTAGDPDRTRITDVARLAGVSPATVSRAMNTPALLTEKTLTKVRDALAQTAYVPNMLAGGLASSRSRSIAFFVPSIALGLFEHTIRQVVETMTSEGYQVSLGFGGHTDEEFNEALKSALARQPDAILAIGVTIEPATRDLLLATAIPIVQAWELPHNPVDMAVGYSHDAVGRSIADWVIRHRYRRPHLLWGTGTRPLVMRHGLIQVLLEAGYPEPSIDMHKFPGEFADGVAAIERISAMPERDRPDCLICISDWVAHGAMVEAARRNIRVPDDIAVIGFGDLDFAGGIQPSLTTIRIDGLEIARNAIEMIMARLAGGQPVNPRVDVGFTLIERESG